MNADFPRLITLLRKEKGISQKQAAAEFGISQALLSHYEKGIRECGLDFLVKCARFYGVSCDYLLGVSPERNGRQLTVEDIPEPDSSKDVIFKGNIMPILNKKLISNSLSIVYDLVGKSESKQMNTEISNYLMMAVYRAFRILYSANPKNENTMFSVPQELVSGYCHASMMVSEARAQQLAQGSDKNPDRVRNIDEMKITTEYLMQNYPKQSQALLNLIQNSENRLGFHDHD
ncbi:helix-turn-helix domain-containing protein [uncultured Negativibacillus sp.]|uniref:helix-turn-helix domain-containing protein n=1 Tax=uncultured Negativibacillus sp. TaxID=1980696 RepID=UPI0025DDF0D0|nr:helix-turn-helix domain-containing protein [uncultured Negativibacillus sp.]